jgi:hypothetical protein
MIMLPSMTALPKLLPARFIREKKAPQPGAMALAKVLNTFGLELFRYLSKTQSEMLGSFKNSP